MISTPGNEVWARGEWHHLSPATIVGHREARQPGHSRPGWVHSLLARKLKMLTQGGRLGQQCCLHTFLFTVVSLSPHG